MANAINATSAAKPATAKDQEIVSPAAAITIAIIVFAYQNALMELQLM
jgi:hypothetical protein